MFWKKEKEQNLIQKLVAEDGIEHATQRFADVVCQKLKTKDLAYQFVLEEVESASQGNHVAKLFAVESGITPNEYRGALQNSCDEIDGPDGPQLFLINISSQLRSDPDLMIEFRTKVVSKLMETFYLGKYEGIEPDEIKKYHHLKKLMFNSSVSEAFKLVFSEAGFVAQSKIDLVTNLLSDDVREDFYTCSDLARDLHEITGIAARELLVATLENRNDTEIRSLITENGKENLSAHRIDELVEKKSCAGLGGFVDLNNDLGYMVAEDVANTDAPNIFMPYLYARRGANAGMFSQGAIDKQTFDHVDSLFYNYMAHVGSKITKDEQRKFQIDSADRALELESKYYLGATSKSTSLLVFAAKQGISIRDALFSALEYNQDDLKKIAEPVMCSGSDWVMRTEYCMGFFASGAWEPSDDFDMTSIKVLKYFESIGVLLELPS